VTEAKLAPETPTPSRRSETRAHLALLAVLELIMAVQLVLLLRRGDVAQAAFVAGIMAVTLAPAVSRRLSVEIPTEIELTAVLFIFATLFLGEVRDWYEHYWWWDAALHTSSGLLLGMLGFMIVYVLNEDRAVDLHMRPAFVALFAFFFAVGLGAIWEVFEFAMDEWFGTNMQPATASDPSGLTDTIQDLIVDTSGAAVVSLWGWRYLRRPHESRIDSWAARFIARHPRVFGD
jgi:VanZ family protein